MACHRSSIRVTAFHFQFPLPRRAPHPPRRGLCSRRSSREPAAGQATERNSWHRKTAHRRRRTRGRRPDSIVEQSTSSSATPSPATSALRYPWCPLTSISYFVKTSSNPARSAFFCRQPPRRHPGGAHQRFRETRGELADARRDQRPARGSVSRVCQSCRLSPLQFTMSAGETPAAASAACPPPARRRQPGACHSAPGWR